MSKMKAPKNKEELLKAIEVKEQEMGLDPEGSKNLFVSYHIRTLDLKEEGFGNMVTRFYPELYKDDMARFITDLEKSITMAVENLEGKKVKVKVLFFR